MLCRFRAFNLFRLLLAVAVCTVAFTQSVKADSLRSSFLSPPDSTKPWVYWYFMDGNETRQGIHADLEAMKKAGIGGAIFLEVDIGVARGPVAFMGQEWQSLFVYAVSEAKRLGIQIALGAGPGWCGDGGPWLKPDQSMQDLVESTTTTSGPSDFDSILSRPQPRIPFFGEWTLNDELHKEWLDSYTDVAVVAFPAPGGSSKVDDIDHKALYYRASYSSMAGTPPRIPSPVDLANIPSNETISPSAIINLTGQMAVDGRLKWHVPSGNWTIMRMCCTPTGQTTRPSPLAGLGFETDKFNPAALQAHFSNYTDKIFNDLGPSYKRGNSGLTMLHFDSWEMSSQNWSPVFRAAFKSRCGYDPLPYLPCLSGYIVQSPEITERFLWDLRHVASDLVVQNHADILAAYAHKHGLTLSLEPYDLNPSADLDLGSAADLPMGEFWSPKWSNPTDFSCIEAVSVGHTNGKRVIGAESFTANPGEDWHQYPGSMKEQLDWAFCDGINKIVIHRYQHQPELDKYPGMTMGPYGVHWERTETWWSMVPAFHTYISRCCQILRQGLPVADILYLTPEGAPEVFTPPTSALTDGFPDRKGYNFDGCSPENLIKNAHVVDGRIVFPGGMSYRILVLPTWNTMTPELLKKIAELVKQGALVVGDPPKQSPSLVGYPNCDQQVKTLVAALWNNSSSIYPPKHPTVLLPATPPDISLKDARWIWYPEGSPASSAPVATRWFTKTIDIPSGKKVAEASAVLTADNSFKLIVNGHIAGTGDNFNVNFVDDITPWVKPGQNSFRIEAGNEGDTPNPAGLIASFSISYTDGSVQRFATGADWNAYKSLTDSAQPAMDLGPMNMSPWSKSDLAKQIYPDYSSIARLLRTIGIGPDFTSGEPLRYTHRRIIGAGDIYFVSNIADTPVSTDATFRTSEHDAEWWNPIDGSIRPLPNSTETNSTTTVPLTLAPRESGFVVFLTPRTKQQPGEANFPLHHVLTTLASPWTVSFDPRWGGPAKTTFTQLTDWTASSNVGIRYYSGTAKYSTIFNAPHGALSGKGPLSLSLGSVKDLASAKLNGHDLGILWCAPWTLKIPAGLLKPTGNILEVSVANLWINRLIADSGLPESQRVTSTNGNDYSPNDPLQPSGLLGPVTLLQSSQ